MIFSAIIKEDIDGATGYGIAPYEMGEGTPIIVNLIEKTVDDIPFNTFIEMYDY